MTTLHNLHIWDGVNHSPANTLQFHGGRITFCGDRGDAPGDRELIDCGGLTAIPGLIDAHVHLELDPNESRPPAATRPQVIPHMRERAAAMAAAGITTARDLGGGAWFELQLRDAIAAGDVPGPRLLGAGQPITTHDGHCHFWGGGAADLEAATEVLQRQVAHKVDLIKIMATGGRMTAGSSPGDAQFSQEDLTALVRMAREADMPVAAHCHGTEGIRRAALAGVTTIEHCSWVGQGGWASDYQGSVARIIAQQGIWVSPTMNKGWQRMLDNPNSAPLERIRSAYRDMLDTGIALIASTDAGIPGVFHHELPQALAVFSRIVQMSPEQTLRSATSDAATALGLADVTGRLMAGLAADIVLLDGDPTENLAVLANPAAVYCAGRPVRHIQGQ